MTPGEALQSGYGNMGPLQGTPDNASTPEPFASEC